MTSAEKIAAFSDALLDVDEVLPGALGAVQAAAAMDKMSGGSGLAGVLGTNAPAELDATFLDIARFALWVRSDDVEPLTLEQLTQPPEIISELIKA